MESLSVSLPGPIARPPVSGSIVNVVPVALRFVSDQKLVRLAASGTDGAMAMIFERHHQALHRYCQSILGNSHDAADALQNAMLKALRALPGETRPIELLPWLYRIAHNESISLLRARRTDSELDVAEPLGDAAAADLAESRDRLRSLTDDLRELTERQRAALLMRELGGMEFADIAQALQTTGAAVKQSVYEARRALHAMEEGREMECETVQRALSDHDRRRLRGARIAGHLRGCGTCRDFETALRERPAKLAALLPPLPAAAAAAMLQSALGGAGSGASAGGGGGLAGGLIGSAKATVGLSLATKAATVAAITATLAGGAIYAVPTLRLAGPARPTPAANTPVKSGTPRANHRATKLAAVERVAPERRVPPAIPDRRVPGNGAGTHRHIGSPVRQHRMRASAAATSDPVVLTTPGSTAGSAPTASLPSPGTTPGPRPGLPSAPPPPVLFAAGPVAPAAQGQPSGPPPPPAPLSQPTAAPLMAALPNPPAAATTAPAPPGPPAAPAARPTPPVPASGEPG